MGKNLDKYKKLFDSVKKQQIRPLYFLYGPEEYLKKEFIRELLQNALPDVNRAFNLDIIYGDEFDRPTFEDRVRSFPLFTDRRVVILRNFKDLSNTNKDYVIASAGELSESIVLVVETPNPKLDTARLNNLKKVASQFGIAFAFVHLDEQETIERLMGRFRREGYRIDPDALDLLVESVGTQLIDLSNEVEKVLLAAGDKKSIDRDLVSSVVGKYRTENLFSMLDSIDVADPSTMIRKINTIVDGGEEPVFVLSMLLKRTLLLLEVKTLVTEMGSKVSSPRALADLMAGVSSPFYAENLRRQSSRFDKQDLENLMTNLRWADLKLKSTQIDSRSVIVEAVLASHLRKTLAYAPN